MGNRLSKIYTRTGDDGTTGLGDGTRVPKDDARVEAFGTVDEANCTVGMILAVPGLDMVQWGPSDFTMSSGLTRGDPEVKATERRLIETSLEMGVAPRIELQNLDNVQYYLDLGVKHFRIGADMAVLRNYYQSNGEALRKLESDGIVEHRPRIGAVIRKLSQTEVVELYEMRLVL